MKAHGLNVTSVKEPWAKVKAEQEEEIWRSEAGRMTKEGPGMCVTLFYKTFV